MARLNGIRIAVVGAGLAGLVAARELARQGAHVHVLEARDRIGGRVRTLRDDAIAPFAVEAGGEFIDGEHKAIRALARELGLPLVRVLSKGFGLALEHSGQVRVHRTQKAIWSAFKRALQPIASRFEERECDWNSSIATAIGSRSLDELLAQQNASTEVRTMAQALRGFFLADSDRLSALIGVELSMEDIDPGHMPLYRIKGGNDQLPLALVRGIDLRLSGRHVVHGVMQTPGHVRLRVQGPGDTLDHIDADYAVVTVPPPILLEWTFSPPLPDDQHRAFRALSSGPATKAIFRFADRWWRRASQPRAFGSNLPVGAVWEAAEEQRGSAMLTFLAGGSASQTLQELLAREGADGVLTRIGWMGRPTAVQAVESVSWERDRWSRSGYAYFSASFEPHLRAALARAFGRVIFAGDHTSRDYQGYMNGAVESGQRAASDVIALETLRGAAGGRPA
jgi:monoamine oxidase